MNLKPRISIALKISVACLLVQPPAAQAEMNFHEMKGIYDLILPQREAFSPIYGFTLLATGTLENLRFYGNYGPKKEGYGCLESATRLHQLLVQNQDCPQDKTSELIQRLFPSQDGINFVANQIDSDVASHLDPKTLGKLVVNLGREQDADLGDPKEVKRLETALTDLLFEGLNPQRYFEKLRTQGQAPKLPHPSSLKKSKGKEKDFKQLAGLLIGALQESRSSPSFYPRHLPEQILLSYFWKKANHKVDFLPLLHGMREFLKDPQFLESPEKQKQFLFQKYSKDDYKAFDLNENSRALAQELVGQPEKLVFLAEQDKLESKALPPILYYASASHSSLGDGTYPDCGETSLRNFFNIVLFDPTQRKFNPKFLDELKNTNPPLQVHPALVSFYENHADPAAAGKQEARDVWSQTVVSAHEGVSYLKPRAEPQCEINAGVDNMMKVIDHLLFQSAQKAGPLAMLSARSAKIDQLCKIFSREGFELSWDLEGWQDNSQLNEHDTDVELKFNINRKPSFGWEFKSGHFVVKNLQQVKDSWINKVANKISDQLAITQAEGSLIQSPLLLHWLTHENNWEELLKNKVRPSPEEVQRLLFYSLPLGNNEVKLSSFEKILKNGHVNLYPVAQRLQAKLPENDLQSKQRLEAALANANYPEPWHDPIHAAGDLEVKYTRVPTDSELWVQLGIGQNKLFQYAWQDPRGLIWSDTLTDYEGQAQKLKWESALNKCLKLNPTPEIQQKVKAFQKFIESNRDLIALRVNYLNSRNEESKTHLLEKYYELKKNKVSGCYLPFSEDYLMLGSDLGYQEVENKFVPSFFRNFYGRWFWAGSPYPDQTSSVLGFNGAKGNVQYFLRSSNEYVRCVCEVNTQSQ